MLFFNDFGIIVFLLIISMYILKSTKQRKFALTVLSEALFVVT